MRTTPDDAPRREGWAVSCEPWAATYGQAYLVDDEESGDGPAEVVEGPSGGLAMYDPPDRPARGEPIAFVDGVRRGEATLYATDDSGAVVHGLAGAYAVGAVVQPEPGTDPDGRLAFARCQPRRLAVWGSGQRFDLPAAPGGWRWQVVSTADPQPDAPLRQLQNSMGEHERRLASALRAEGYLVVADGTLKGLRSLEEPVIGYIKTHHRPLLGPEHHALVTRLGPGQRTALFAARPDIYSCYHRLSATDRWASPWQGIVRLEFPAAMGVDQAADLADHAIAHLPRFAGVAHCDPRAPQNLQPVGALEQHLRHLLGPQDLASRAARHSIATLLPSGAAA